MIPFHELRMYGRFLGGLPGFLRHPITLEDAKRRIADRLATRESAFVRFAERALFGVARSPYPELMRLAGGDPRDLPGLVRARGIEGALLELRAAGVYVTFEEFKGRTPIVRHGREVTVRTADFNNPLLARTFERTTSGSTGVATRVSTDLDHLSLQAEHRLVTYAAHGLAGAPWGIWRPPLPAGSGIDNVLRGARMSNPPARWFTPLVHTDFRPGLKYRLATATTLAVGRALGARLPWPEHVRLDEAVHIARWMADTRDARGRCWINTTVSGGLRVATAARGAGIDLQGTTIMVAGEPASTAKVRGIRASGAATFTDYGMAEAGRLGMGCAASTDATDVHLLTDAYAVIPWARRLQPGGERIDSFHVTGWHPSAPKLLLNVEFDDYGVIEGRRCGCLLGELGLHVHLHTIRSYGKLTGEGVTLVGSEMVRILEEVLPSRFGGSPLDYQLTEEEDGSGLTRLWLLVGPDVVATDEEEVRRVVLNALSESSAAADVAGAFWRQASTIGVRRGAARTTDRGKQHALHSARRGGHTA